MVDINALIAAHTGIVYTLLTSFELQNDQDAESLGYDALYKAALTYKESKKTKFSTYAFCVVSNAMRMHLRTKNKKRQIQYISYHSPVSNDEDCNIELVDTLEHDMKADAGLYTEEFMKDLKWALHQVYADLTTVEQKKIFAIWVNEGFTIKQTEVAARLGISQAAVSRTISSFRYKLKQELEEYL